MKIAIADNNSKKFTADLIAYWSGEGHEIKMQHPNHEVKYEPGASEFLAQWADVYYIDTWDNNIHYLYKLYHGQHDDMPENWDNNKKPKIIVRALDWEIWIGLVRSQEMIDWVDEVICIAPHMEKQLRNDKDNATGKTLDWGNKLHLIRPGVNLNKFTLKTKETDGFQLGMVLGDMWKYKNHMGGLDIFTTLYQQDSRWRLHIRGQHENGTYDPINFDHYLDSRSIRDVVTLYPHVPDMNEWYENIDVLLHPGQKEAFCYAVAEAMAKGIKPVINDFYGSKDIWPSWSIYKTNQEAVTKLSVNAKDYKHPIAFREFIEDNYSNQKMFEEFDKLL